MSETKNIQPEHIVDGSAAAAMTAYRCTEGAFIYPITPSSAASEFYESQSAAGAKNMYGRISSVRQLQSEGGAAGAVHGALSTGSLITTFTASQGLLLMIPVMNKISGELLPCVFHVSARAIAGQALSIFGDHSDVMACRQLGWGMLTGSTVQETVDMALISHIATLECSIPIIHFYDGFRVSHEIQKVNLFTPEFIYSIMPHDKISEFRSRGLNPSHPYVKGTSQGPEVYMQNMELANPYYSAMPDIIQKCMDKVAQHSGRQYKLFDYFGDPEATDVIVAMGNAIPVTREALSVDKLSIGKGLVAVRLYRPWDAERFMASLPKTCVRIAVLDKTKESGALGEPLYLDVCTTIQQNSSNIVKKIIGGRYGLGSREYTPSMAFAVYANLQSENSKHPFTVGINDDVSYLSLDYSMYNISTVPCGTKECVFWGMGSDGTVSANKNAIKIIGENTSMNVQGYFAYSAYKAGGLTLSHLRFGKEQILTQYLIERCDYIAVHRDQYIFDFNVTENLKDNGIFVLNCIWPANEVERHLPAQMKANLAKKNARMFVIDANKVANDVGMGRRVNTILLSVFFKVSEVLPFELALDLYKKSIVKAYGKKGEHVVQANFRAVDASIENLEEVRYDIKEWADYDNDGSDSTKHSFTEVCVKKSPEMNVKLFCEEVAEHVNKMDPTLPVSAFSPYEGGKIPLGTANFEKKGIALEVPVVDMDKCTQCNYCAFVCPHAAIRPFLLNENEVEHAPEGFVVKKSKGVPEVASYSYRIQVAPLDCTGCQLCAIACPDDALTMVSLDTVKSSESRRWEYARSLPNRGELIPSSSRSTLKGSQFYQPLLEFSGACAGCGETPYVKLMTQLFGERMVIANATGCSSIWGASYPSVPYTTNEKGYGPAWANSLFENNAEFGYGMAISVDYRRNHLRDVVNSVLNTKELVDICPSEMIDLLKEWVDNWKNENICQRIHESIIIYLDEVKDKNPVLLDLYEHRDMFQKITIWMIGGDGWAYDIGYGGLDHVVAQGIDIKVLILDTEVYSNTGGQVSKATVAGAVHKFASGGRTRNKKDLGTIIMDYGDIYVASVSSSANMAQTVRAFVEADRYDGCAVILAYSPCIEHQYIKPFHQQITNCKLSVDCGYWPLYRYNPALEDAGELPFQLDSKKLKANVKDFFSIENRFAILNRAAPDVAEKAIVQVDDWIQKRFNRMKFKNEYGDDGSRMVAQNTDGEVIHVLYGSETGNAEELAGRVVKILKERTIEAKLISMDDTDVEEISNMKTCMIVCSTAGQGELPDNAKSLYAELKKIPAGEKPFSSVKFGVFGLGDSSYVFFCEAAKMFQSKFEELGATCLVPIGLGDDLDEDKYDTKFDDWMPEYLTAVNAPELLNQSEVPDEPSFYVFEVDEKLRESVIKPAIHPGSQHIILDVNKRITPEDYDVEVRHLEFDLSGTGITYALGDSLAIWPQNCPELVEEFCQYFGYDPDMQINIKPTVHANNKLTRLFSHTMTVKQLLVECLDIFGKPSRAFYEVLWKHVKNPEEKVECKKLMTTEEGKQIIMEWTADTLTVFDVMKKYSTIKPSLAQLIDLVPLLKCRYYSIASSQKFVGMNRLELCVGIVDWMSKSGVSRAGECTGYIRRLAKIPGRHTVCGAIKATAFNLPPSEDIPMLVAGMGTGIAPFRAFVQHKVWAKRAGKTIGPVIVYFGCRYSQKDFLYAEEWKEYAKEGIISHLKCAFSRDQKEKHYIQHEITKDPDTFYDNFMVKEGFFYLCGSASQVPIDMKNAIKEVISNKEGISQEEANEKITKLIIKGRYNVEAWG